MKCFKNKSFWLLGVLFMGLCAPFISAQWVLQRPADQVSRNGMSAISTTTAWTVGANGNILKTSDGGINWTLQSSGTTQFLTDIICINSSTCWATGKNGTLIKTTNGGVNWNLQSTTTTAHLNDVHFIGTNTGWIVGENGTILKSSDGGTTWAAQISGTTNRLNNVFFLDANTGFVVGDKGLILKSINGGGTWTNISIAALHHIRSVYFTSAANGFITTHTGFIFNSTDGGASWNVQRTGSLLDEETPWLEHIHFTDANNGFAVGRWNQILQTTNAGATWISASPHLTNSPSGRGLFFTHVGLGAPGTGWITGRNGDIHKKTASSACIDLSFESQQASAGSSVTVPVNGTLMNNLGAITLEITFDPAALTFNSVTNAPTGTLVNVVGNTITIVWSDATPINLGTGKLLDLNFTYLGGTSALNISTTPTEFADSVANVLCHTQQTGTVTALTVGGLISFNGGVKGIGNVHLSLATTNQVTSTTGAFTFGGLNNGAYPLTVSKTGNTGGFNATDALLVLRKAVGMQTLTPLQNKAADVNNSNTINATDALLIRRRSVNLITSFSRGDWVFDCPSTITLTNAPLTLNCGGLPVGDVNGSYSGVGGVYLSQAVVPQQWHVNQIAKNEELILGLYPSENMAVGAVDVQLQLPQGLSLTKIDFMGNSEAWIQKIEDDTIRFNWLDASAGEKPMYLYQNQPIALLTVTQKLGSVQEGIQFSSAFSSSQGEILPQLKLNLQSANVATETPTMLNLHDVYPNPLHQEAIIQFSLPKTETIKLSLFDITGREVQVLLAQNMPSGVHSVPLLGEQLPAGVYFYRLQAGNQTITKKLVVQH